MDRTWYGLLKEYGPEIFGQRENTFHKLLKEDFIEIMYNGWNQVYLEDLEGIRPIENLFASSKIYEQEVARFLASQNQRLSVDRSILNFSMDNKYRVQVLHQHISGGNTILSFRRSASDRFGLGDFYSSDFLNPDQYELLANLVKKRKTIFICGETSSGKTTLLNFLLGEIDKEERLIVIEDTREVKVPDDRNVVYLRTSLEEYKKEEISAGDLVKASLRLRPDRIILGEIRKDEVVDFLHAINTGHKGSLCTGHGNSPQDMVNRLEMLLMEAGVPYEAASIYLGRGIDVICFLEGKLKRQLRSISKVDYVDGEVVISEILGDSRT